MAGGLQRGVAGFVLAGGRSSRMGTDKSLLDLSGEPLIAHALRNLREAGLSCAVAGGQPALERFARVVPDPAPGLGPLSGVCSALADSEADLAVFAPVDLPLLPSSLLLYLLAHAGVTGREFTLASVNGFPQTFPVVVHRRTLPLLENELHAGRRSCLAAFFVAAAGLGSEVTVLPVEPLVQTGQASHLDALHPARWFLNVNRPEDLRLVRSIVTRRVA